MGLGGKMRADVRGIAPKSFSIGYRLSIHGIWGERKREEEGIDMTNDVLLAVRSQ